jgi:hypothetical protein
MGHKRTERMLNADKAMNQRPRWTEAVIPVNVGTNRRCTDMLRACSNGDIYYYGKLIGNDEDVATALIDIVNSHQNTAGGASDQAACWAITELIRRKDTSEPEVPSTLCDPADCDLKSFHRYRS